jgi:hypothetical protein
VSLNLGAQEWLIIDAHNFLALKNKSYATDTSPHDRWLPWYDKNSAEFSANTALEAYEKTVVAPIEQAKIYDRQSGRYLPESSTMLTHMQAIHDLVAPLVGSLEREESRLFVRLLLRTVSSTYELLTFEIFKDGKIESVSQEHFIDPYHIGLPETRALGFFSMQD